jgi:hypothetical protein
MIQMMHLHSSTLKFLVVTSLLSHAARSFIRWAINGVVVVYMVERSSHNNEVLSRLHCVMLMAAQKAPLVCTVYDSHEYINPAAAPMFSLLY